MQLRIFVIAILVCCFASTMAGRADYFDTRMVRESKDFRFPIFARASDTKVATRINRLLQLSELYSLAKPPYSSRMFAQSRANDGSIYGGKVSLIVTVYTNNNRILSLGFDQSACGATCGYWNRYYNFNSGNGDRIELRDLFTPKGYKSFQESLLKRRTVKYQKEVKNKVELQYQESYMDTVGCFEAADLADFRIWSRSIVVDGYNCLTKGQKFDGLDMTVAMPVSGFTRYLNRYGRTVFDLDPGSISSFRSRELPQLFEGSVNGTYPIAMVLTPDFGTGFGGFYAYLKYGEGLALKGNKIGNEFKFDEYILSPKVVDGPLGEIRKAIVSGHISGQINGLSFEGVWSDTAQTKQLDFRAVIK